MICSDTDSDLGIDDVDEKTLSAPLKRRVRELKFGWKRGEKLIDERAVSSASGTIRRYDPKLKMDSPDRSRY